MRVEVGPRGGGTTTTSEEPLSPAARVFHDPSFNCHIIAKMGCKTSIDPAVFIDGLKHTLIKHPRFSSKLVVNDDKSQKKRWVPTTVNVEDHVVVPELDLKTDSPDQFVEDYISHITTVHMDFSKPLWEVHILNVKTSDAEALVVFKIHHSIGDGASLMSLLLACTRKTSDPEALPTVPGSERKDSAMSIGFWGFLVAIWLVLRLAFNTLVDIVLFLATLLFLRDTNTPIKGASGVELKPKRFIHRTVSLDDIKLVKNAMNATINDVLLGVTEAGLSLYINRRYGENEKDDKATKKRINLPESIRLRSAILVNIRPSTGIQALADMMAKESKSGWGNRIGYILLPFHIALHDDPLKYIRSAKRTIDGKKISLEAICTNLAATVIAKLFGAKAAAAIAHRVLSNTTLSFSNVVGPVEEISFSGHPMAYLAPSVYGHPHALTMHFQSYTDKMTIALAIDPEVIPDPYRLFDDLEGSLTAMKDAVVQRELNYKKEAVK
ncbi:O-acyltransferase WSD1-like isoform X2 [Tripterygium wilfordii]|uniref:O-acyltransferase WSD1-like isoform X2 n=1 Tax=Tripterygium wilfordii TaxID=458696 RepID=A0A7J7CE32_TRIWF|nr:O-acyltransferase WSD1-like [Tripterygium wilfordii]KAF5732424.1 O-acyltransferase WSD1-like isoform X2 [Tripterygium wilfordii]